MKLQQNGTCKLLYPRTLILRDLQTFLMIKNDVSDFDTPNMSTNDENIQGQSEEQDGLQQQFQGIREDGRDFQDWVACNVNRPYIEPPREHEESLPPANSTSGDTSLRTNSTMHGRQGVDNQTQDPNDELQDIETSLTTSGDTMASEEHPMYDNDVPPINPVLPSRNEIIVQGADGGGPAHCVVFPNRIYGVDTKKNARLPTLENINMLNATPIGIQEVATHPTPPSQPWQLFKSPADVPRTSVCNIYPASHASNAC